MPTLPERKKVCLITTGHLSSDPRLVKEALALDQAGYDVHLIYTSYMPYLDQYDRRLLANNPGWTAQYLDWTGSSVLSRFNRLRGRLGQAFRSMLGIRRDRNSRWLYQTAVACQADLYIAHNLGALPVAVRAARKNHAFSGFDAEDLHRYESSDDLNSADVQAKIEIEDRYIPLLDHFSAASPLIAEYYRDLYDREVLTILNVFPKTPPLRPLTDIGPLRLFWFSQTIGPDRGIEQTLEAIGLYGQPMEFHLLGTPSPGYPEKLSELADRIAPACTLKLLPPVYPDELFELAGRYDIGLASELKVPLNRDICLTNKIFTYLQCGLAVLASDTQAQTQFITEHPGIGYTYRDAADLAGYLQRFDEDRALLRSTQQTAHDLGQHQLNWEQESARFLQAINDLYT